MKEKVIALESHRNHFVNEELGLTCRLQSRVNRMEHSIGSIVTKIDAMLIKLDGMEKSKDKKRETMSKMLNAITEDDQGKQFTVI
jgi:hypothetical protein